jgi:hypothetical protein
MAQYLPVNDIIDKTGASVYRGVFVSEDALKYAYPTDLPGATAAVYNTLTNEGGWFVFLNGDWIALGRVNASILDRPANLQPANGSTGVYQIPLFQGTKYTYTGANLEFVAFEVYLDVGKTQPVLIEDVYASNTYFEVPSFYSLIQPGTTYWWCFSYVSEDGNRTQPSALTNFTTKAVFDPVAIKTPQIYYPNSGWKIAVNALIAFSSEFETVPGGQDTHYSTDWRARSHTDTETGDIYQSLDDTVNLTNLVFPVTLHDTVYVDCRYKGNLSVSASPWSNLVELDPRRYYTNPLIGVGFRVISDTPYSFSYPAGTGHYLPNLAGVHIDKDGNEVSLNHDYFDTHPLWKMNEVTLLPYPDSQEMIVIPRVYVKAEKNPNAKVGEFRFKYWLSTEPFDGAYLHPAFRYSMGPIYWGKWPGGVTTNNNSNTAIAQNYQDGQFPMSSSMGLQGNQTQYSLYSQAYQFTSNWLPLCDSLNTGVDQDHKGWHIMSVYDYALLYLMQIIEGKSWVWPGLIVDMDLVTNKPYPYTMLSYANENPKTKYRKMFDPFNSLIKQWCTRTYVQGLLSGMESFVYGNLDYGLGLDSYWDNPTYITMRAALLNGTTNADVAITLKFGSPDDLITAVSVTTSIKLLKLTVQNAASFSPNTYTADSNKAEWAKVGSFLGSTTNYRDSMDYLIADWAGGWHSGLSCDLLLMFIPSDWISNQTILANSGLVMGGQFGAHMMYTWTNWKNQKMHPAPQKMGTSNLPRSDCYAAITFCQGLVNSNIGVAYNVCSGRCAKAIRP